jgi:hypothetical protein
MHGKRSPVREVYYGAGGGRLFLRIDFHDSKDDPLAGVEIRLGVQGSPAPFGSLGVFDPATGSSFVTGTAFAGAQCAFQNILEAGIPFASLGAAADQPIRFQFSLWKDGLPMGAIPQQGWLELPAAVGE